MVLSLVMLRRGYAYISLVFLAVWTLINLSYMNQMTAANQRTAPHLNHDGDEKNEIHLRTNDDARNPPEEVTMAQREQIYIKHDALLTPDELLDIEHAMDRHSFNISASNAIPLDREVPNFKPALCPRVFSSTYLPRVSIIICFHNEALSTLLRTLYSIVRTTPSELLREIILIDDASTYDYLGRKLTDALKVFPQVNLLRSDNRLGIAKARTRGMLKANAKVLVFFDSHCECSEGWLEPLLAALLENPKQIVCPDVDIINYDTFEYTKPDQSYEGSFDWELNMVLKPLSDRQIQARKSPIDPIRTPTMLGGLFAVAADYLRNIGSFDYNMEIWGGENMELSFRVWMCGGSILILPCSRVGHVFRPVIPYGFPHHGAVMTLHRNNQRVAEAWMQGFKKYYYGASRKRPTIDPGPIQRMADLIRSKLHCNDFYWYLTNISPEIAVPPDNAEYFGQIRQKGACVDLRPDGQLIFADCVPQKSSQTFHMTPEGRLMHVSRCLTYSDLGLRLLMFSSCDSRPLTCAFIGTSQLMCDHENNGALWCLQSSETSEPIYLHRCSTDVMSSQLWSFTHHIDLNIMNSPL